MTNASFRYAVLLLAVFLGVGGITLAPGQLRVTGHEFDLVHTLDIAYRYAAGDQPHVDVMTPLGVFSILPISVFLQNGFGPGMSYLWAQILVTGILLPGVWWIGHSRLGGWQRGLYGVAMVLLGLSLIFGNDNPSITTAMYYNRWAWILCSFAVLIVMIAPREGARSPVADGLLLGAAGAALALIKVTYVMALLPAVAVYFLVNRAWAALGFSIIGAAIVLAIPTLTWGVGFWSAYIGDLVTVATGTTRTYPGVTLNEIAASPGTLAQTLLLLAAIMFWRKAGRMSEGLMLLLLAPGFVYITYQNWGNDPKWLFFLGLLLLALPPSDARKPVWSVPGGTFGRVLALICFVLYLPSMITISTSSLRHLALSGEDYTPLFPGADKSDIEIQIAKSYAPSAQVPIPDIPLPEGHEPDVDDLPVTSITLNGEDLLDCSLRDGFSGWTQKMLGQLARVDAAQGRRVLVADVYDHLWLYGPYARNIGAAPWYYGSDDGIDGAEFVLVPLCAMAPEARRQKLDLIAEKGWSLTEIQRTDLFILFRPAG